MPNGNIPGKHSVEPLSHFLVRYNVTQGRFVVPPAILQEDRGLPMTPQLDVVQRLIITRHRELFEESPSPMKLQKLCYYAQGYLLAQNKELFKEDFQAWQHGPVVPSLYRRYKDYGWRSIAEDIPFDIADIDAGVAQEISDIVAAYGRYDGAALSTMTHREAPWLDARGDLPETQGSTEIITKDALRAYFTVKLAADGGQ
ncbi:type II toxin-antitoxin system antitoxin SocA domain-containing protein [Massilia sp. Root133]|jgi:uncharacterized phage-associated protein|uniref:Panacea domain-containing protein n=1 Tax=Massilia sp. Root133 TaxID=1736455 RepID=UPI0009EC8406|nr:type II toxin-antitoxin system antitoxin SocA domain-containing protein [Massilia sp. Root133]